MKREDQMKLPYEKPEVLVFQLEMDARILEGSPDEGEGNGSTDGWHYYGD